MLLSYLETPLPPCLKDSSLGSLPQNVRPLCYNTEYYLPCLEAFSLSFVTMSKKQLKRLDITFFAKSKSLVLTSCCCLLRAFILEFLSTTSSLRFEFLATLYCLSASVLAATPFAAPFATPSTAAACPATLAVTVLLATAIACLKSLLAFLETTSFVYCCLSLKEQFDTTYKQYKQLLKKDKIKEIVCLKKEL